MFKHLDFWNITLRTQVCMSVPSTKFVMEDTNQSSLISFVSLSTVKGKASVLHVLIMGNASWCFTTPCEFNTTMIGLSLNCHTSSMYLMPKVDEKCGTTYHFISQSRTSSSNLFCGSSTHVFTIGIHTILYWSFLLISS